MTYTKKQKITKEGLIKLLINTFLLASTLSFIVAFVGNHVETIYGTSISHGFGLIIFVIGWLTQTQSTENIKSKIKIKFWLSIIFIIFSFILLPSILTFIMGGLSIIIIGIQEVYNKWIR